MPHTLIISDLHLSPRHERITELFLRFLRDTAPQADALYVLGDLFDYWAGDDDLDEPLHRQTADAFRALSGGGVPVFLMHGNRDFLMAEKFAAACGATLLDDPALLDFYGTSTLLTHGDALCTDDTGYQVYRQQVRNPVWQQQFLSQPLAQRKAQIEALRARSESEKRYKSDEIMDVNSDAVAALLRQHGYPRLIHGHTHRPGLTLHEVDGHTCERWVLGDWDDACGNALHCEGGECRAVKLT